jgi:hypothetical protein
MGATTVHAPIAMDEYERRRAPHACTGRTAGPINPTPFTEQAHEPYQLCVFHGPFLVAAAGIVVMAGVSPPVCSLLITSFMMTRRWLPSSILLLDLFDNSGQDPGLKSRLRCPCGPLFLFQGFGLEFFFPDGRRERMTRNGWDIYRGRPNQTELRGPNRFSYGPNFFGRKHAFRARNG